MTICVCIYIHMNYETFIRRINIIYSLTYSYSYIQSSVNDEEKQNISKPIVKLLIEIINGKQPVTVDKSIVDEILNNYIIPNIDNFKIAIGSIIQNQTDDIIPNLETDLDSFFTRNVNNAQNINTDISNLDKALALYIKTITHCEKNKCKNVNTVACIDFIESLIRFYYFMYIFNKFESNETYAASSPFPLYKINIPDTFSNIASMFGIPNPYPLLTIINNYNVRTIMDEYTYTRDQIYYCTNKNNLIKPNTFTGRSVEGLMTGKYKILYYLKKCTPVVFSTIFNVLMNLILKEKGKPITVEIILPEEKKLCDEYKQNLKNLYKEQENQSKNSLECIFDEYDRFISTIKTNIIDENTINPSVNPDTYGVSKQPNTRPTESNDVLELIEIMTPFIDMMYDTITRSYTDKAAKKQWNPTKCDASHYKEISTSLAQFLHDVYKYEYFNKLSPELKKGLTDEQKYTFEQIKKIFLYANTKNKPILKTETSGDVIKRSVAVLTELIAYKLNSTQCQITNKFISDLNTKATKALQPSALTIANIQPHLSNTKQIERLSNVTTYESNTSSSQRSNNDEINTTSVDQSEIIPTSVDQSEINRIGIYPQNIINYVDSVTASIVPFEERNSQGGKTHTRRKKPSKTLHKHKQTLRKKHHKKTRRN